MVNVYNKETGALIWNGADDQVPTAIGIGDEISFTEDTYVIEEIKPDGGNMVLFVRHLQS